MNPLYKEIVGTWVRAGLVAVSAVLIQHHIVTAAQGDALSAQLFDQILNAVPAVMALAWSMTQKYGSRLKLVTALTMPAGATETAVEAKIAAGVGIPPVTTAATIVPTAKVIVCLLAVGLLCSGCVNALANFATVTSTEINTVPALKCNAALVVPGCLTDAQVQQIEGDLHDISVAGATYTLALMQVNGDPSKAILQFAAFIAVVGPAEVDIANVAGPNAAAVVQALKDAVKKL